jgi:multidrug resistance protein, MATE family
MGMSLTDTAMVAGLFGTDAFASVAVGSDLYSIAFYLGAGTLAGVAPFYTAAAARADADARPGSSGSVGWRWHSSRRSRCRCSGLPPRLLARFGLDPALLATGEGHTRALALTLVPMLGVVLYRTLLTAAERPQVFLRVTLAMLPLNAGANYVLMIGLGPISAFGPTGAGLSSLLVATATLAVLAAVARRSRPAARPDAALDWAGVLAVLRVGVPIGIATVTEVGIFLGAALYAARLGAADVAAHTLTLRIAGVAYAIPTALLQASMVRIARADSLGDARAARGVVARASASRSCSA